KQNGLVATAAVAKLSQAYIKDVTTLSNNLLDLELLEVSNEQQRLLEAIVGTATRIDDLLFTLSNNVKSIKHITALQTLEE
ncbi:hypothetical protein ACKI16_47995, partial [Streptomyces scabiei]|uniref:hypothetical protein n=1 Tax=Streptomyces scabiei TaxID=1930 RepID=UPI0038F7A5B1